MNSEAAYQAQKCIDDSERSKFAALGAHEAKRPGRKVNFRADWNKVEISLMKDIVHEKFYQNHHRMLEYVIIVKYL